MSGIFNIETDSEPSVYSEPYQVEELPGIYITENTRDKLKFYFQPKDIIQHVDPNLRMKCTIVHKKTYSGKEYWTIKYNSFPVDYRWRIYSYFWEKNFFRVTNIDLLNEALAFIYGVLREWAQYEEKRIVKLERDFRAGIVELHEFEESLILTPEELLEAQIKRARILARMIPPE